MISNPTVTVYSFRVYHGHAEQPRIAAFKATRQRISELQGELLESTGEPIETKALDHQGQYRRVAAGWNDLDE